MILKTIIFGILILTGISVGMDTGCDDSSDYATDCPIWANEGYCTKSSEFMKEYCKKSCDECPSKIKKYFCQVRWEQFPKPNGLIYNLSGGNARGPLFHSVLTNP